MRNFEVGDKVIGTGSDEVIGKRRGTIVTNEGDCFLVDLKKERPTTHRGMHNELLTNTGWYVGEKDIRLAPKRRRAKK